MTDSTCLACESTAMNINKYIKFINCLNDLERLTNYYLKCFKAKVVINVFFIDGNLASSWCKIYSSDTAFSSSGSSYNFV